MADDASAAGLDVAAMPDAAQAELKAMLPYASPRNPVDATAQALTDLPLMTNYIRTMLEKGGYGMFAGIFGSGPASPTFAASLRQTLEDATTGQRDCVLSLTMSAPPDIVRSYEDKGFLVFEDGTALVNALGALVQFGRNFATAKHDEGARRRRLSDAGNWRSAERASGEVDPEQGRHQFSRAKRLLSRTTMPATIAESDRLSRRAEDLFARYRPQDRDRRRRGGHQEQAGCPAGGGDYSRQCPQASSRCAIGGHPDIADDHRRRRDDRGRCARSDLRACGDVRPRRHLRRGAQGCHIPRGSVRRGGGASHDPRNSRVTRCSRACVARRLRMSTRWRRCCPTCRALRRQMPT